MGIILNLSLFPPLLSTKFCVVSWTKSLESHVQAPVLSPLNNFMSFHAYPCSHFPSISFPHSDLSYLCDMNFASHYHQVKNLEWFPVTCRVKSKPLRDQKAVSAALAYLTSCVPSHTSHLFSSHEPRAQPGGDMFLPAPVSLHTHFPSARDIFPFLFLGVFLFLSRHFLHCDPTVLCPSLFYNLSCCSFTHLLVYILSWIVTYWEWRQGITHFLYLLSYSSAQHVFVAECGRSWYNLDCRMLSLM